MNPEKNERAIITISKDHLATLPAAEYTGKIVIVDTPEKVEAAVKELSKSPLIGFDTETRPSFRKGQSFNVALVQLATPECSFLFRINKIGFPSELIKILENPKLTKVGLSIHDDFHGLEKIAEIIPQSFIDLQNYTKNFKIEDNSLSRMYAILFGERISKGQRLTNWEADELTDLQLHYAALDAFACIKIYNYLKDGLFNPFESKYLTYPAEENKEGEADNHES